MAKRKLVLRKDEEGVSPVIATILMVAITVVLAAVLYVMVAELIKTDPTPPGTVAFSPPEPAPGGGGDDWDFRIAAADGEPFASYRVLVLEDGTQLLGPENLVAGSPIPGMGSVNALHLNLTDLDEGGDLTAGDTFRLGNTEPGKRYELVILGRDGDEVGRSTLAA